MRVNAGASSASPQEWDRDGNPRFAFHWLFFGEVRAEIGRLLRGVHTLGSEAIQLRASPAVALRIETSSVAPRRGGGLAAHLQRGRDSSRGTVNAKQ